MTLSDRTKNLKRISGYRVNSPVPQSLHGQVGWMPRLVGGEESRPYNHLFISRKPRPVGGELFHCFGGFRHWRITLRSLGACAPKRFGAQGRRRVFLWRYHGLSPWGSIWVRDSTPTLCAMRSQAL